MGISEDLFWTLNPHRLKPYLEAEKLRQQQRDSEMWRMGIYVFDGVRAAVENVLNGRKSKLKYMEKPLFEKAEQQSVELSEEEKVKQAEKIMLQLAVMSANSKLGKKENKSCQTEQPQTTT